MVDTPREISAGGVVLCNGQVVLLQRESGEWVMPKGHVKRGETQEQAALREVEEETGLRARIVARLGETYYRFALPPSKELRDKTVHWFLMSADRGAFQPENSFREGAIVGPEEALSMLAFENDRRMLRRALLLRQHGPSSEF